MTIVFDRPATRILEAWAVSYGIRLSDDTKADAKVIGDLLAGFIATELDKFKPTTPTQPEKRASSATNS